MVVQSALLSNHYPAFGFFEFAWLGIPMCILFLIYYATAGKYIGNRLWRADLPHGDMVHDVQAKRSASSGCGELLSAGRRKQGLSVAILLGAILGMVIPNSISNGTMAIAAAVLCIVTGCIPLKQVYAKFDWSTIFVLAGGIGFANGLDKSGGGRLIADWIITLFGDRLTPMAIFCAFVITSALLTQFMSNTAVAVMLTPIALSFVPVLGINPLALLMGICAATNLSFCTPIATPSMTLVLGPGEYRFLDYLKYGGVLNLVYILLILLITPVVWPLAQ